MRRDRRVERAQPAAQAAGYIEHDYDRLFDQRRGKRSIHQPPMETTERVLALYRDKYPDFNVRHFREKLSAG
jgi:hypothetical protein